MASTIPGLPSALEKSDVVLRGPSNEPLNVLGKFTSTIQWKQNSVKQCVYVVTPLRSVLLALPAIEALSTINLVNAVTTRKSVEACYPQLFNGLGTMAGGYKLSLRPDPVPFAIYTARRMPFACKTLLSKSWSEWSETKSFAKWMNRKSGVQTWYPSWNRHEKYEFSLF